MVVLTTTGCFGDTTSDRALLHTAVLHLQRDGHLALIRPGGNQLPLAAGQRLDLIHIEQLEDSDATTTLLRR